jgi:magnesium-transporting ATPase (P-type)
VPIYDKNERNSEYIYYNKDNSQPFVLSFFQLFAAYFILFNNIIPISLTITFEIAKGIQVYYIEQDPELGKANGEEMKILSLKLQEDLGNVKYLFTDKTGTLTKNEMEFKACSIFTKLFEEDISEFSRIERPSMGFKKSIFSAFFDHSLLRTCLQNDTPIYLNEEHSAIKSTKDALAEFFLNIVLNQNVLVEVDAESGIKSYQGPSPDECALVQAACEIGVEFMDRIAKEIVINFRGEEVRYEILQRFEFSSERGRSSIIVKDIKTGEIKLYMKGADNIILKKIDVYSTSNLLQSTKEHLNKFAKMGLRTLCYSYKILDEAQYNEWKLIYDDIKYKALVDKSLNIKLEETISSIEDKMVLLGVSGLEDKLQDNVKNTIQEFIEADIHVWMLTGDKLDTAESIGYSSQLFNDDTEVYKLQSGDTKDELKIKMKEILDEITQLEKEAIRMKLERKRKIKQTNISQPVSIGPTPKRSRKNLSVIKEEHTRKFTENNNEVEESELKVNNFQPTPMKSKKASYQNSSSVTNGQVGIFNNNNNNNFELQDIDLKDGVNNYSMAEYENQNNTNILPIVTDQSNRSVDDISVIKFMMDKKFFENGNSYNKAIENMTFMKRILMMKDDSKKRENLESENKVVSEENKEAENNNNAADVKIGPEHVDLSNLYDFYQKELKRIEIKKDSSKKLLKYASLNFNGLKKKRKGEEDEIVELKHKKMLNFGIIIEGDAINSCLHADLAPTFWKLVKKTNSVICCRCNPIQKSEIVSFVKNKSKEVCLAIGDGGNDVNMIKTANVGVGIFGKEGYQAAYNSDYAISQFQYLKRLMFYHGRYSLLRNSYFIYFFFYKSIIFCTVNLWYAFFCGFSGTNFWDDVYFILYTSILTTMPPVVVMVYHMDIDIDFAEYKNRDRLTW